MKPSLLRWISNSTVRLCLSGAVLAASLLPNFAQSDNFNDGDDKGWARYAPLEILGVPSVFSFPDDGMGGKAYRIQSAAPPIALLGPARAGSRIPAAYSDFIAAADVIDWDNSLDQSIGFLFRTENLGVGTTTGYSLNYNVQQVAGGPGQVQFNMVTAEVPSGAIRFADLSLEPGRRYRFVLRAQGEQFAAKVYDLLDLTSPIVSLSVENSVYASGEVGLFTFYAGTTETDPVAGVSDATFDNYTAGTDPPSVPEPGTPRGIPGWPQPIVLTPLNGTSFFPASSGVQFTATTLSEEKVQREDVTLLLNGKSMNGSLAFEDSEQGLIVRLEGLEANTVYDASIGLKNAAGVRSKTEWTFDTFSDAFLESGDVKLIEAEDYNFGGGQFIDNPPASGRRSDMTDVNASSGYLDRIGEPGIDYFDRTDAEGGGNTPAYRGADFVGTQAGSAEIGSIDRFGGLDAPINDVIRRKYAALDLPEYQVSGTEAGEWLNYTREFPEIRYRAYLRVAARATQPVFLDRVTTAPSQPNQSLSRLGVFNVPNLGLKTNYRFVALTDDTGEPVTLDLSGLTTLRLTLGGEPGLPTQGTMALNYLVFVPAESEAGAEIIVESAATIDGPFEVESAAILSDDSVSIPIARRVRFFRFRLPSGTGDSFRILGVTAEGRNLIVRFAR